MTPEQLEHAAEECTKALEEFSLFIKKDGRSKDALGFLKEIIALAKSTIPSGQVAEDERKIMRYLEQPKMALDGEMGPLHRLATQAQSADAYRGMWIEAERGRNALLAERDALRRERDDYRQKMMEEGGKFLKEMQRADLLQDKADRLSAAGQVLSEHVDKVGERPSPCGHDLCEGVCTKYGPSPEHADAATAEFLASGPRVVAKAPEWTMRDEFARAALQGILANHTTQELPDVCAKAAYIAADAMMAERAKT